MNIFYAAMLRSGSTHIEHGLVTMLSGWRSENAININGEGQGEQLLNPFSYAMVVSRDKQVIGGHHCAYADTLSKLRAANMKPSVIIRNLYDSTLSCVERIDQNGGFGSSLPPARIPVLWNDWDYERKCDWVAYNTGVWQIKFFISWQEATINKLWVRYEEFFADQPAGWTKILEFNGLPVPGRIVLENCALCRNANFNKGVSGRGQSLPRSSRKILDGIVSSWGPAYEKQIREFLY